MRTDAEAAGAKWALKRAELAAAVGADPWAWVLGGGEDHALVACFTGPVPAGWRVIGFDTVMARNSELTLATGTRSRSAS